MGYDFVPIFVISYFCVHHFKLNMNCLLCYIRMNLSSYKWRAMVASCPSSKIAKCDLSFGDFYWHVIVLVPDTGRWPSLPGGLSLYHINSCSCYFAFVSHTSCPFLAVNLAVSPKHPSSCEPVPHQACSPSYIPPFGWSPQILHSKLLGFTAQSNHILTTAGGRLKEEPYICRPWFIQVNRLSSVSACFVKHTFPYLVRGTDIYCRVSDVHRYTGLEIITYGCLCMLQGKSVQQEQL